MLIQIITNKLQLMQIQVKVLLNIVQIVAQNLKMEQSFAKVVDQKLIKK